MNTIKVFLLGLLFTSTVFADVNADFARAKEIFSHRDAQDQTETLNIVKKLTADVSGQMLYEVYILGSGAALWQGRAHTKDKKARMDLNKLGIDFASKAIKLSPNFSSGYLWRAYNLGEYALLEGKVLAALKGHGLAIKSDLKAAIARVTPDGNPGESESGYGPDRALGKYYTTIPFFLGGNRSKGLGLLKKAYDQKIHALNYVFYAEALMIGSAQERALAKQILQELLATNPNQFDPNSLGELNFNLNLAKDLLKKL